MKYTIFQVDDSRQQNVDRIREYMKSWDEVPNVSYDGRGIGPAPYAGGLNGGQIGVWTSFRRAVLQAPIMTFDDDANITASFATFAQDMIARLPSDADFLAFYVPQRFEYMYRDRHDIGDSQICRAYQPNGAVAMYYTEQGREKIAKLLDRDGVKMQYDNQLFNYSWRGELNGYGFKPGACRVDHDDLAPSLIQERDEV